VSRMSWPRRGGLFGIRFPGVGGGAQQVADLRGCASDPSHEGLRFSLRHSYLLVISK
jgi:hypothetical protein